MYLEDAVDFFIADRKTFCAPATIYYYTENLHRFIAFLDSREVYEIEQFTQDDIKEYLLFLRSKNIKNTSIRCYFRAVNAFCFFLIDQELLPYFKYKLKMPRPDPDPVLPLTAAEVDLLIRTVRLTSDPKYCIRDILIVRLMLDMGLRSSEIRNLRRKDVQDNVLTIVNSKYDKSRVLPVPPEVFRLFSEYNLDRFRSNAFIFDISKNGIKQFFRRLKHRSGIARLHAHLLRHTFATSYMLHNRNIEYLRIYLGHEDYATTRTYVHLASQCLLTHYDVYRIPEVFI